MTGKPAPTPGAAASLDRRLRANLLEMAAVCGWMVFPSIAHSVLQPERDRNPFRLSVIGETIGNSVGGTAILLFIIWSSGDRWSKFGLVRFRPVRDLSVGAVLAASIYLAFRLPLQIRLHHDLPGFRDFLPKISVASAALTLFGIGSAAVFEEVLFRGYLIARVGELSKNPWVGVLLSATLFSVGHLYEGAFGVYYAFSLGLLYGIAFVKFKTLWPLVLAHAFANAAAVFFF